MDGHEPIAPTEFAASNPLIFNAFSRNCFFRSQRAAIVAYFLQRAINMGPVQPAGINKAGLTKSPGESMKSISKRTSKNGVVTWQAIVRMKNEKTVTATKPTFAEAQDFADRTEKAFEAVAAAKATPSSTLPASGDWADEKLKTTFALFAASRRCLESHRPILTSLKSKVGWVTIGELDEEWIQEYVAKTRRTNSNQGRPYAVSTIVKHVAFIGVVLRWRAKQLKLPRPEFVLDRTLLPKGWDAGRKRRLEPGEAYLIGMAIRKSKRMDPQRRRQYLLLVRFALETAARLQEMVLADWSEISLGRKSWSIPGLHTKCDYDRCVPISPRAGRILIRLRAMQIPGDTKVFGHLPRPNTVSKYFHAATERSGVEDLVFHDLRHEAISRFVNHPDAYPVPRLMKITGHSDYKTFEQYLTFRDNERGDFMS